MIKSQWAQVSPPATGNKADIVVRSIRKLTPEENRGKCHIFVRYIENGVEVRGSGRLLKAGWRGMQSAPVLYPLDKPLQEAATNAPMDNINATYWVEMAINGLSSERVEGLHTRWEDETPPADGLGGCSTGHHSFEIVFEREQRATVQSINDSSTIPDSDSTSISNQAHHLFAMHDPGEWEGWVRAAGRTAWCVHSEEIGCDPNNHKGKNFAREGITAIVRLNHGYEPNGTIPQRDKYADFARRAANFVAASQGCDWVIIGNEIALPCEWPKGVPISLADYVECYNLCFDAIKAVKPSVKISPQAVAPWNPSMGDWCEHQYDMLHLIGASRVDFISLHAYTHSHIKESVRSRAVMEPPYQKRYFEFLVFSDFLNWVPFTMRHLPVFITEANPCGWQDTNNGWIREVYDFIDEWNRDPTKQPIWCVAFYRFQQHDHPKYWVSNKPGVIDDFRQALQVDRRVPVRRVPRVPPISPKVERHGAVTFPTPTPTAQARTLTRARLRRSPALAHSNVIGVVPAGFILAFYGQETEADGLKWVYVGDAALGNGWMARADGEGTPLLEVLP